MVSNASAQVARDLARLERGYGAVVFLNWFATVFPSAIIVVFAQARGLNLAQIGVYLAVYGVTVALLEIPTGNLADHAGRKRVALLGYGLAMVAKLVLLFAFSLPAFLVYAVLWGSARALGSGALEAWFVERIRQIDPNADLQPRLAAANTWQLVALAAGSLLGAALPAWLAAVAPNLAFGRSGLEVTVFASVVLHLIAFAATARIIHDPAAPRTAFVRALGAGVQRLPSALEAAWRTVRTNRVLPWMLALEGLAGLVVAASETYWQPFFVRRFALPDTQTALLGVVLAGCFAAGVLGNLCTRPWLRLLGGRTSWLGGSTQALQGFALLGLAWQHHFWIAAALLWLTYFARTVFSSVFLGLYNAQITATQRSLMLSVLSVAFYLGSAFGNAALGLVSARTSIAWAWTGVAALVLLSAPLYLKLRREG
jgi:predicted MFS family arabinose efflux permease